MFEVDDKKETPLCKIKVLVSVVAEIMQLIE